MPISPRSTAEQLVADVAAILDIEITNDTIPSELQVVRWLNEAAVITASVLPPEACVSITTTSSFTVTDYASYGESGASSTPLRMLSVKKFGKPCEVIYDPHVFLRRKANYGMIYNREFPLCLISGGSAGMSLSFFPEDSGTAELRFICYPEEYVLGEDQSALGYLPPKSWEKILVDYAVMRGRLQDEEPGQAEQQYKFWMDSVKLFGQNRNLMPDSR